MHNRGHSWTGWAYNTTRYALRKVNEKKNSTTKVNVNPVHTQSNVIGRSSLLSVPLKAEAIEMKGNMMVSDVLGCCIHLLSQDPSGLRLA